MKKIKSKNKTCSHAEASLCPPKPRVKDGAKAWRKVKLGEVVEIIDGDRGVNYPGNGEFFKNSYCLFLNAKNVCGTGFDFSDTQFITKKKDNLLRSGKIQRGDFVLTTRGTVGNIAYYSKEVSYDHVRINSGMVVLRPKKDIINEKFFHLFLISQEFKNQIEALKSGSAQPQLPIRDLKFFEINTPFLDEQERIVKILYPIGDKIELNNKINQNLEQMAQAIFKEWFIKFKFPRWQKAEFVNSELGKIPKGWDVGRIKDLMDVISGFPFSSKLYNSSKDALGVVTIKNVQDGNFIRDFDSLIKKEDLPNKFNPDCHLRDGDILLSLTGNVGRVCFVYGGQYLLNQRVAKLKPKELKDLAFCYFLFRQMAMQNYLINMAKGSAQPNLSPVETGKIQLCVPPREILDNFSKLVGPIYQRLIKNVEENQKLSSFRDLLLPKLISGKIVV